MQDINQKKEIEIIFSQGSPMSLEKPIFHSSSSKKNLQKRRESIKEMRMNFFDVDEYRADVYNYLRAAEVCSIFLYFHLCFKFKIIKLIHALINKMFYFRNTIDQNQGI